MSNFADDFPCSTCYNGIIKTYDKSLHGKTREGFLFAENEVD